MKKIYYSIGRSVMDDKKDLKRLSFSLDSYTFYIIPISIKTVLKKTTIVNAIVSAVNNGEDLTPFRSKGLNQKTPLKSEMEITEEDWNMLLSLLGQ